MALSQSTLFNEAAFKSKMVEHLVKDMKEAAEPYLQQSLKEIEVKMRERMAAFIIGRIETHFDVATNGDVLTIRVLQGKR